LNPEAQALYVRRALARLLAAPAKAPAPPAVAEALVHFISPKRSLEQKLGDMQELFETERVRFGIKRARKKYWYRAAREILPSVGHKLKRLGLIAVLVDYIRAKFGI
jgi:hypothetical protein